MTVFKILFARIIDLLLRDRSIFMGIRDREICNGTTGYFGPSVEQGHWLFCRLALQGHSSFRCSISTGPKIILMYCCTGSWTVINFYRSFSYKKVPIISPSCISINIDRSLMLLSRTWPFSRTLLSRTCCSLRYIDSLRPPLFFHSSEKFLLLQFFRGKVLSSFHFFVE